MSLKTGEILQARYHVNTILKSGGMGSIYLAHDANLDGPCAIKEMHPTDDSWVSRRFREEANLLSQLQHPNIPRVRDFFQLEREGGVLCYIVMDFVQGITLHQELEMAIKEGHQGLDSAMARQITLELLGVLEYLHSLKPPIIHRDIKPANVIRDSESGKLYLVDFGLARGTSEHTQTTAGTLMFCPPEQMLGKADIRSDLYALGATLYLLLTGQPIQMGRYTPVLGQRPDIEPQLAETVDKVLQLDPDQRFQSAAEMRAFLTRPYVRPTGPSAWPKRAGTAAVILLALGLIGLKPWLERRQPTQPIPSPRGQSSTPAPAIQVVHVDPRPTWFLREKAFTSGDMTTGTQRMLADLNEAAQEKQVAGLGYIRWHKFTLGEMDYEVGLVFEKKQPAPGGSIQSGSLPGGSVITLTHKGGYEHLQDRYVELRKWAVDQHLNVDEAPWGIYRVTGLQTPDPGQWETDLYYLMK
ncbi:protein kinase [bacterium]|nr:protein kinase [bacterium]